MNIAVTGHRPQRLGDHDPDRLIALAVATLEHYRPTLVYTGMAQGWDTAVARACVRLTVPFIAVLPHPLQAASWPYPDYRMHERLMAEAVQPVQVIGQGRDGYKARNMWMVDRAEMILSLFDGREYGGTHHTAWYAEAKSVRVVNLWSSWQKGKDQCST